MLTDDRARAKFLLRNNKCFLKIKLYLRLNDPGSYRDVKSGPFACFLYVVYNIHLKARVLQEVSKYEQKTLNSYYKMNDYESLS